MDVGKDELDSMRVIQEVLEGLPDDPTRRRVATWVFSRFAEDAPARHGEGVQPLESSPASVQTARLHRTVAAFIAAENPRTKGDRLLHLLRWVEANGGPSPAIKLLNDLNRQAGGDPFSDAGSIGQSLIKAGYVRRPSPGCLTLTESGRDRVDGTRAARGGHH